MSEKKPLADFIRKLKEKYKDVKVYLFGSRARGDELKGSDYDLIIISEKFKEKRFVERLIEMQFLWEGNELLESLYYTPEEFENMKKKINIVSHAMKYAKRII